MGLCISHDKYLEESTFKSVSKFSFDGWIFQAKVVDVYDGDTCKVNVRYKDEIIQLTIRMLGYNSPEIKVSKKKPEEERIEEKRKAIIARDYLRGLILNKIVRLVCSKCGKYGRVLGTIYIGKKNVNKIMLKKGYGVPFMVNHK